MKAIIFNLLAWVMLPIMDGFAKYLSADLPVLQITWARYFFTVAFTLPFMFFFSRNVTIIFVISSIWILENKRLGHLTILKDLSCILSKVLLFGP